LQDDDDDDIVQGLLKRAAVFYESTIGLQKTFDPAVIRLAAVLCELSSDADGAHHTPYARKNPSSSHSAPSSESTNTRA
jgi:hypothetical protein